MLLTLEVVPVLISAGASARVAAHVAPRFPVGDTVLIKNRQPATHTRLLGHIRGKKGIVEKECGVFAFPNTHAPLKNEQPQHGYRARFAARELWGEQTSDRDSLRVDAFDDYVDPRWPPTGLTRYWKKFVPV